MLVLLILLKCAQFIDFSTLSYKDNIFLSIVVLQLLIFFIPGIFYCKLKPAGYISKLRLRLFGLNKIYFTVLAFLTVMTGTALINFIMMKAGAFSGTSLPFGTYFSGEAYDAKSTVYIIIALALIPSVCEEFIFRSIILTEYRESTGNVAVSVLLSSLLFAMTHMSLSNLPAVFFSGLVLAFTAYATGSVLACIIVHFANNLVTLFFESYIIRFIGNVNSIVLFAFILVLLFLLCGVLLFAESERIYYSDGMNGTRVEEKHGEKFGGKLATALLSPTLLLCVVLYLVSAFGII